MEGKGSFSVGKEPGESAHGERRRQRQLGGSKPEGRVSAKLARVAEPLGPGPAGAAVWGCEVASLPRRLQGSLPGSAPDPQGTPIPDT